MPVRLGPRARPVPLQAVAKPLSVPRMRSDVHELVNRMVVEGNATMMAKALKIMTAISAASRPFSVGNSEVYGVKKYTNGSMTPTRGLVSVVPAAGHGIP